MAVNQSTAELSLLGLGICLVGNQNEMLKLVFDLYGAIKARQRLRQENQKKSASNQSRPRALSFPNYVHVRDIPFSACTPELQQSNANMTCGADGPI
jgi:hypothetical protein